MITKGGEIVLEYEMDKLLALHRKPHRIIIFNVDSEIRSICFPNYRRVEKLIFEQQAGEP
jgi:hypothetical protein